jgi:hypothetical protein
MKPHHRQYYQQLTKEREEIIEKIRTDMYPEIPKKFFLEIQNFLKIIMPMQNSDDEVDGRRVYAENERLKKTILTTLNTWFASRTSETEEMVKYSLMDKGNMTSFRGEDIIEISQSIH